LWVQRILAKSKLFTSINKFMEGEGWITICDFKENDPGLNVMESILEDLKELNSTFPGTKYLVAIMRHFSLDLEKGILNRLEQLLDCPDMLYEDVAKMELILKDLALIVETSPSPVELEEASKQILYVPEEEEAEEEEDEEEKKSGDKRARVVNRLE
jgi:hypothetical protein